jgi:hypothetical protein
VIYGAGQKKWAQEPTRPRAQGYNYTTRPQNSHPTPFHRPDILPYMQQKHLQKIEYMIPEPFSSLLHGPNACSSTPASKEKGGEAQKHPRPTKEKRCGPVASRQSARRRGAFQYLLRPKGKPLAVGRGLGEQKPTLGVHLNFAQSIWHNVRQILGFFKTYGIQRTPDTVWSGEGCWGAGGVEGRGPQSAFFLRVVSAAVRGTLCWPSL